MRKSGIAVFALPAGELRTGCAVARHVNRALVSFAVICGFGHHERDEVAVAADLHVRGEIEVVQV